jgi:hypothetical protein
MATIWITYAWADNQHSDIDFVAQELGRAGLTVKLDRWNLGAGKRLWEQIESFICQKDQSDAWLIVATNNSLASEPCKEEFAYALDRALKSRGEAFPVIALFLTHADPALIPAGIRTRLHVSITDPDWKERIVAAAERRAHAASRPEVQPYSLHVHHLQGRSKPIAIEVRPRAGVWAPFVAGVPLSEKEKVQPFIMIGPRDVPTDGGMLTNCGEGPSQDNSWWLLNAGNQSTPTESYYVWCMILPSKLIFGVNGRQPQFMVTFT